MKTIYAINGGPRKKWNTAHMLESFLEGIRSVEPDAEIKVIHLYDLNYKGCRGCLGCKLKTTAPNQCIFHDDAFEILKGMKESDGVILASPIYYFDVTAQLRALLERLFFPGDSEKTIPAALIYTMNQPREVMENRFRPFLNAIRKFMSVTFHTEPEEVCAFQTLQWDHNERYEFDEEFYQERVRRNKEQFPEDLKNAYEAGVRFAEKL